VSKLKKLAAATAGLCLGMLVVAPTAAFAAVSGSVTPNTNLTDGQFVHVTASGFPANQANISVTECIRGALSSADCEGRTQNITGSADSFGNFDLPSYKVRTLPDTAISTPAILCDGSGQHECDLFIGANLNDFTDPGGKTFVPIEFAAPGQGVPEVPYAVILPLSVLIVLAVAFTLHRRRNSSLPTA
jgi:hypothetical protein